MLRPNVLKKKLNSMISIPNAKEVAAGITIRATRNKSS